MAHETGKNSNLTKKELELLSVIAVKLGARLIHTITKYPSKSFLKTVLRVLKARRTRTSVRLLSRLLNDSQFKNTDKLDLRKVIIEGLIEDDHYMTDPVSSWDSKDITRSSSIQKEATFIAQSFKRRGIAENIVGIDNVKKIKKAKDIEGFPSLYYLSDNSTKLIELLSRREAVEFLTNCLRNSGILSIFYSHVFASFFYLIRDEKESDLNFFLDFIPEGKALSFVKDEGFKQRLLSIPDSQFLAFSMELGATISESDNAMNNPLLSLSFLKLSSSAK